MANLIKLRRSAVQGNVPTTGQLALGEVAMNTHDGKLFLKKDDGTESIVEVGATDLGITTTTTSNTITSSTGSNATINEATSSAAGLMSTAQHDKLDGIEAGATNVTNNNQLINGAGYITDAGVTQIVAGTNVTISPVDGTGVVTINATGGGGGGAVDSVNGQTGDVVLDAADVGAATAAQGALADSALQPGDNVSELVNDANYITQADLESADADGGYFGDLPNPDGGDFDDGTTTSLLAYPVDGGNFDTGTSQAYGDSFFNGGEAT